MSTTKMFPVIFMFHLFQEFDTLGIPKIDILKTNDETEILEQLMQNSYMLIQMYRRKLKQISSMRLSIANQDTLRLRMNVSILYFFYYD